MRPIGSAEVLEARRQRAATLLERGSGIREVARQVGAAPSSVKRWKDLIEKGGKEALMAKPHPGRTPRLSPEQRKELLGLLLEGPLAHGYANQLWTLPRIARAIEDHFGVRYHPAHVWKILHACGWSCQKPQRWSKERDEEQIQA
jgi:transposase